MRKFSISLILLICSFQYGLLVADAAKCEDQKFPEYPCCGISSNKIPNAKNNKIAGLNEFPWMVYLKYAKFSVTYNKQLSHSCGGSLVNTRWVLTSTTCLNDNDPDYYKVHLGEWKLHNNPDCITADTCAPDVLIMGIDKIIRHESYMEYLKIYDIGLVRLKKSVTYNDFIRPICLPPKEWETRVFDGKKAILSDWRERKIGVQQTELRKAALKLISIKQCKTLLKYPYISELELCTVGDQKIDTCLGYSGAPLTLNWPIEESKNMRSAYVLIGIFSRAPGNTTNCLPQFPNTFTQVATYIDWIKEVIQKHK